MYNEKRYVGVIVYFTVMFDHPSCFLTFCRSGIPTSCYIFKCFLLLVYVIFFGSRRMFELKFAAEVSDLTGTWAVGVLALPWYMTQVLYFQHWLKNQARASQLNCNKATEFSLSEDHGIGSL